MDMSATRVPSKTAAVPAVNGISVVVERSMDIVKSVWALTTTPWTLHNDGPRTVGMVAYVPIARPVMDDGSNCIHGWPPRGSSNNDDLVDGRADVEPTKERARAGVKPTNAGAAPATAQRRVRSFRIGDVQSRRSPPRSTHIHRDTHPWAYELHTHGQALSCNNADFAARRRSSRDLVVPRRDVR